MRFCVALALACAAWATQPPHAPAQTAASPTPTLSAHSTLVLVPALVRNKAGQLVFTLQADDFVLTDDGVEQKLKLEQDTGGEPLALVVVLEGGGAGARELDKYAALAPMIGSVIGNVPHRVAVVGFDSAPVLVQDFTPDLDAAARAVQALIADDSGDSGAAILDSLGFSLDLLRKQPSEYRRAILLISETLDRGSHLKLEDALRAVSDTNTAIYSIGFSSGRSEVAHYAYRELPTQKAEPTGPFEATFENANPGPPHGCMGKEPNPDADAPKGKLSKAYDCLGLLVPPLALARMAVIAATDGLQKNIPETVARLTGGEYFKLTNAKSLELDLATLSNHMPNRYVLSFQPQSPHPGLHAIGLHLRNYANLDVTARRSYWADTEAQPTDNP